MPITIDIKDAGESLITQKYNLEIGSHPEIGKPVTTEIFLAGTKWRYREYSGEASIYASPDAGAFLLTGLIRIKWISMLGGFGPNGFPTGDVRVSGKDRKGWICNFENGAIAWKKDTCEAFPVYGVIYKKWIKAGGVNGPLGFPLSDVSDYLVNGGYMGKYSAFDHGAIFYLEASKKAFVIQSPVLEAWILKNRENGWLKYPVSDTSGTLTLGEKKPLKGKPHKLFQDFQGGTVECTENQSISLVSPTIITRIDPLTRQALLTDFANKSDNRIYPLINLDNFKIEFKTANVIFKKSYMRAFTQKQILQINKEYQIATDKFEEFSFGQAKIHHDTFQISRGLTREHFSDLNDETHTGENVFYAVFNAYNLVKEAIENQGKSIDSYDIVSISFPWEDDDTNKSAWFAWANCEDRYRWKNGKTWSTVHNIYSNPYWWAFYLHETMHCIEWMLEDNGYPELRNNDDFFWLRSYPELYTSDISPQPVNLTAKNGDLLFAIITRIKEHWKDLAGKWGNSVSSISLPVGPQAEEKDILVYSSPDYSTLIESSVKAKYQTNH